MSGTQTESCSESLNLGDDLDVNIVAQVEAFTKAWKHKTKVLICQPTMGSINYKTHECCWDLAFSLARYEEKSKYKFFKVGVGRLLTAYARERMAEFAYNFKFDYIFFIDDDHLFKPDIFERLEKHIKDNDIVAPLCLQRQEPFYPVIYKSEMQKKGDGYVINNEKYVETHDVKKGDIITDADAVGFGAVILKVDLLRKMPRPWFFSMSPVGEDILFCMKAKQHAKAKLLIDTNIEVPHLQESKPVFWKDFEVNYGKIKKDRRNNADDKQNVDTVLKS